MLFRSLSLGAGKSWWSTRLHLLAAILGEYSQVEQIAFTTEHWNYLGMCSPVDVRRALSIYFPKVEMAYRSSLPEPAGAVFDRLKEVDTIIENFVQAMEASGGEEDVRKWVTAGVLQDWRGFDGGGIELTGQDSKRLLVRAVLRSRSPFVALLREGALVGILDRVALATQVSLRAFK